MSSASRWWETFFDDAYADRVLARIDPATTDATVDFLMRHLELDEGSRVLDQCCGVGRLSVALARRGATVIGVDDNEAYVARAEARARQAGAPARHVAQDASTFVAEPPVDAAVSWFTSFGYRDRDFDRALFARAFESLRPGGRFALDTFNLIDVLAGLEGGGLPARVRRAASRALSVWSRERYPHERGGAIEVTGARADFVRGVLTSRWSIGSEERESRLSMYMPHELARLLAEVGFEAPALHGSTRGEPFGPRSPRCILVARRPT